ncbi:MAG: cell wall anchor protein, partial [Pseudoflavonifractor sp.]
NQMVGPIPITASFELGAAIQLDFKMASRYKVMGEGLEWSDSYKDKQYVSDFLTTLRINAYFEAFGGIGFDISIVALKFGVFGRLGVDNSNAFLSRTYLKDENKRQVNGQALKLTGEVGIEFVLTVIGIIDYQATLASIEMAWTKYFNNWEGIQDYWKNTGSGLSLGGLAAFGARNGLTLVDASASLQSRDYLEDFDRTWGAPRRMSRALDGTSGLLALQSNAYPNSRPYVTDDGKYLLYTSDQDSSELTSARVYATALTSGAYPQGAVIAAPTDFPGFGDSDLRLAGKDGLAVAAWVRQNTGHQLKAGDPVTPNTQSVLTNATEIVASVNTGSGWTSTRLTENGSPDLAPVVAANDSKAIVAWRSVYAADAAKPMDFTAQDKVLYKIYDKTENKWSDAKTLYPGTSGVVKGIEAAM